MGKFLSNLLKETKQVPKTAWVAALVIPGGFLVIGTYLITKTANTKEEKDDQRKDSEGLGSAE